jgi:hypothetical protein
MTYYDGALCPSSTGTRAPRHRKNPNLKRRRLTAEMWASLRAAIDRQHKAIKARDPLSPRIKPSVGSASVVSR